MSLEKGQTFESELKRVLLDAKLPDCAQYTIGRSYRFGCVHGSHHHILTGRILAIEISDEGSLDLYVTNPRLWGLKLISIRYDNSKWMAYVDIPYSHGERDDELKKSMPMMTPTERILASNFFEGEFKLL
jgi:hypothetical protein